jgi:hypothetical protein
VLFLSETKLQPSHSSVILNTLCFYLILHAPPSGTKGELLLAWRHSVDLVYCLSSTNILFVWCYFDSPDSHWLLSCIYGPHVHKNKNMLWDSLLDVGKNFHGP